MVSIWKQNIIIEKSLVLELHLELVDLEPQPVDLGVVRVQVDDRLVLYLPRSVGVPEEDSKICIW